MTTLGMDNPMNWHRKDGHLMGMDTSRDEHPRDGLYQGDGHPKGDGNPMEMDTPMDGHSQGDGHPKGDGNPMEIDTPRDGHPQDLHSGQATEVNWLREEVTRLREELQHQQDLCAQYQQEATTHLRDQQQQLATAEVARLQELQAGQAAEVTRMREEVTRLREELQHQQNLCAQYQQEATTHLKDQQQQLATAEVARLQAELQAGQAAEVTWLREEVARLREELQHQQGLCTQYQLEATTLRTSAELRDQQQQLATAEVARLQGRGAQRGGGHGGVVGMVW
ncbi:hypothetical protein llap_20858 [Limosa lapponica baueri]|uniref:Uncharacterized protein n=1 Tax=Limosa lapponica baueri TaxID=1758121 RepID=A0A2I0T4Z1_LIMLA|nr:hypothetical protein llap_20858 [Limosa lapponica baueri]